MLRKINYIHQIVAVLFISVLLIYSCIDEFKLQLQNYDKILVVDALITNEVKSHLVKLSYTYKNIDDDPVMVNGATVFVEDDKGNSYSLVQTSDGHYNTSIEDKFIVGNSYALNIELNGEKYRSDFSLMIEPPEIDTLYTRKSVLFNKTRNENMVGLEYMVDVNANNNQTDYLRWSYEEAWEFVKPYTTYYVWDEDDLIPVTSLPRCWRHSKSSSTVLHSFIDKTDKNIQEKSVAFIQTSTSDRFLYNHCLILKQYAISKNEYEFFQNMIDLSENTGTLYDKQPFSLKSNIRNTNGNRKVIGYFHVSGMKEKRMFSYSEDIIGLGLDLGEIEKCSSFEALNFLTSYIADPVKAVEELYRIQVFGSVVCLGYKYPPESGALVPIGLNFGNINCVDCSTTGDPVKPWYWID